LVKLQNLSIKLDKFELKSINLNIEQGEIFAILGPTGSGKSTLLESIAGFYIPDNGKIFINGRDISFLPPEERNLGFVYQDYSLFPHLTVYKNIEFGLKIKQLFKGERSKKINELTDFLGITHLLDRYPNSLSGGEQQRAALARALVINPKLLLMDEPFSSLDSNTKEKMYDVLQTIHKKFNCTIIFVTHDISEAKRLANRVGIICNGSLKVVHQADKLTEAMIY